MNENSIQIQIIFNNSNDYINNEIDNNYQTIESINPNPNTITNIDVYKYMSIEEYYVLQNKKNILIKENAELKKENEALTEEIMEEINNLQKQIIELTNKIKNLQKENKKLIKRISRLSYN